MQHSGWVIRPTRRTATFHILQTNSQYTILYNIIFGTGDNDKQPGSIPGDTVRDGVHYEPILSWLWPVLRFKKGNVLENYSPKDIDWAMLLMDSSRFANFLLLTLIRMAGGIYELFVHWTSNRYYWQWPEEKKSYKKLDLFHVECIKYIVLSVLIKSCFKQFFN